MYCLVLSSVVGKIEESLIDSTKFDLWFDDLLKRDSARGFVEFSNVNLRFYKVCS